MSGDAAAPSDDLWHQVLAADFVRAAWGPLAGDLVAHPALGSLLGNLAAHAAVYATLAREWDAHLDDPETRGSPASGAPSTGTQAPAPGLPVTSDSPLLAMWRPLFQPWLEVVGTTESPHTGKRWGGDCVLALDIDALLGRIQGLAGHVDGPQRLSEIRHALAAFANSLQDYLVVWRDIMATALGRFRSQLTGSEAVPESLRGFYDLWVDISEEVYAERAVTPEFARSQGRLINAYFNLCKHDRALRQAQDTLSAECEVANAHEWEQAIAELRRYLELIRDTVAAHPDLADAPAAAPDGDQTALEGSHANL